MSPGAYLAICTSPQCRTSAGCVCNLQTMHAVSGQGVVPANQLNPSPIAVPVAEAFYAGAVPPPRIDRRNARSRRTRAAILAACRQLMRVGAFRPSMGWICETAERCTRTGFQQFNDIEKLYMEAIQDHTTRQAIAVYLVGDELVALSPETVQRMVRAAVLGRRE